ncbi:SDR family oxidoreductase [Acidicapsa dinghuensis]|uniref:SDR family oxidoreductase n=1 Tax=Acidicapsa dinghuensis TaxID=2218256 RepID=A0ABW1EDT2_9BACT|nr:SDR family oxidoreductase [Acidicapsa dinghuensis]
MRVFLTGATGFIGSAIIPELIQAGHQVLGLSRSDTGADALRAAGADVQRGSLEDIESLRSGAAASDGVIHCAFDHSAFDQGFSRFIEACEQDRRAIETMGSVLAGSNRPLIITSGTGMGLPGPGRPAVEDHLDLEHPNPRTASEAGCVALSERGINVSVVRLPQVHNTVKQGLITYLVRIAREKGVSAYVGEGQNRWPAAHVLDVARLYRLALEKAESGRRYNAVAEEGIPTREIAEILGKGLKVPVVSLSSEKAQAHFGWLAMFSGLDMPASSALTRQRLGWNPTGPTLITDLENMRYF